MKQHHKIRKYMLKQYLNGEKKWPDFTQENESLYGIIDVNITIIIANSM